MKSIEYDTSEKDFFTVLKPWQLKAMQVVWGCPKGVNSRGVWSEVNMMMNGETISRASIINFLEDLREIGVISGEEKTGKGGHHWVYSPKLDETGFKRFITNTLLDSLMQSFPEETREAIRRLS